MDKKRFHIILQLIDIEYSVRTFYDEQGFPKKVFNQMEAGDTYFISWDRSINRPYFECIGPKGDHKEFRWLERHEHFYVKFVELLRLNIQHQDY